MYSLSMMGPEFNLFRKKIRRELILAERRTKKKSLGITPCLQ